MLLSRATLSVTSGADRRLQVALNLVKLLLPPNSVRTYAVSAKLEKAAARLKTLREEPDNDVKLKIYALFKQATIGDVNVPKPGAFDFIGKAKWAAWKEIEGTAKEQAESQYIDLVDQLLNEQKSSEQVQTMDSGCEGLVITKQNGVFTVRLNRPSKKNSLSFEMYKEITRLLKETANDSSVNYFVLTGTADYFSSGNDLGNFSEKLKTGADLVVMAKESADLVKDYIGAFIDFPKPMVALVNGPSIGVSCTVLGLFDLVYASDVATFQTPFSKLGLSPEGCSSVTFPRILGGPLAAEVLLMNRILSAAEAKAAGFVTDVFPAAIFEAECAKRIEYLRKQPPKSLMYSKMLIRNPIKAELHKANADECRRLEERFLSDEAIKAVTAFFKSKNKL
ncbi:enoyl-CoA delta isomerase 2, mitochondrial-like [Varroa jacobsoni]|uniref:enoyl-CoA delta isomerase 2, mitochondrial-like n=1 Tax=Varroa jacobsoni TaxID=62625 RepID=UPI000BFA7661|nr:enoyl-CoA delta isomerase 2, mitochondrial-like [Varroa jacobsoni]